MSGDDLAPVARVELVRTGLRTIWEQTGRLVPAEIVDLAADPAHPLHPCFEWDDGEAGRKFRILEAAMMIRSVKVIVAAPRDGELGEYRIRAYIASRDAGTPGAGYVPELEVRDRPDQRERVLRQMQRELNAYRRRYGHLSEFWSAIQRLADDGDGEAVS